MAHLERIERHFKVHVKKIVEGVELLVVGIGDEDYVVGAEKGNEDERRARQAPAQGEREGGRGGGM